MVRDVPSITGVPVTPSELPFEAMLPQGSPEVTAVPSEIDAVDQTLAPVAALNA